MRLIIIFMACMGLISCRGDKSTKPPILPIQNMVDQTSYGPQAPNTFFADKRASREPLPNTIAEDDARIDSRYDRGQEPNSTPTSPQWVKKFPLKLDENIVSQGQKNFNIYCGPCHGRSGHNDGLITRRSNGTIRPADIHEARVVGLPVGKIYDAVTNGVNNWNMPGFSSQLSTQERWGVVSYVRALQISEQARESDMPKDIQSNKGGKK